MKALFIHAKSRLDVIPVVRKVKSGRKFGLVTTVQHLHTLEDAQKILPGSVIGGQVLGCDASAAKRISRKVDAFLFIGSGEFHPLRIVQETGKDVYCADPYTGSVRVFTKEDVGQWNRRTRGAFLKFLDSEKIGILVSIKHGQSRMREAEQFRDGVKKKAFIFVFDTLDFREMENFPDIECWVNTACPRIGYDDAKRISKPIINLDDLKRLL